MPGAWKWCGIAVVALAWGVSAGWVWAAEGEGEGDGGPLVADFAAAPTSGQVPLPVQFTDTSTSSVGQIESWAWNFGDGTTSSEQNPVHTYECSGEYTVSLIVLAGTSTDRATKPDYIATESILSCLPCGGPGLKDLPVISSLAKEAMGCALSPDSMVAPRAPFRSAGGDVFVLGSMCTALLASGKKRGGE